ncbi:ABC transporter permease [Aeromicrobium sp. A1-2]|uniref:ABC transporter permease n=1 Tax=Aeromicrobium sp. A1-2 TaxID=2107713 RepID=UPI000E5285E6|nr:ABC transporter permease [Aeromicrobium sp. A1-2]AXT84261.1 ABC transporter permease [Aeromicrobium sp. A1-2]
MRSLARTSPELVRTIAIALVAFAIFSLTQPDFLRVNNVYTIMQGMVFLGLGALAFGLTIIAGEMDLAVPSTATVAGIVTIQVSGSGLFVSIVVGLLVGLAIGIVQGLLVWQVRLHSVVITIGTSTALLGLALILSDTSTVVTPDLNLSSQIQQQWFIFSPGSLLAIFFFVLVGVTLKVTTWGVEVRAFGGGRAEAIASGVPAWRPLLIVFAASGLLSGLLGALASLSVGSADASSFSNLLLSAVAAALIGGVALSGGRGSALGIAIGVLTLRFVNSGLSLAGSPFYVINMAIGLLLLGVVALELLSHRGIGLRTILPRSSTVDEPAPMPTGRT